VPPHTAAVVTLRTLHLGSQIKQQELAALQHVRKNPVKMAAIRKEVEDLQAAKRAKKEAKKEKKREKKEAKRAKKDAERLPGTRAVPLGFQFSR
jgi:hypothetical protein